MRAWSALRRALRIPRRAARIVGAAALLIAALARGADSSCPVCVDPSFGPVARAFSTRYPGQQYYYGADAGAVVAGDFNNDGIPDLAVSGGLLLIYLGTGSGSYAPPVPLSYGGPLWPVAGDFDGDGNLDLAVGSNGKLNVLLGDGTGAFPRVRVAPFSFVVGRFTAGDFDGDGILDLAEPISTNQLSILHGAGDGSFSIAQTLTIGTESFPFNPVVPRAADLNGDGIDDLAIANIGDGKIGIVLGRPGGGWTVSYIPAFAQVGGDLQVGDFDGDRIPDLVVESSPLYGSPHSITILKGQGDGMFHAINSFVIAYYFLFTIGDFDGDGNLDIAMYRKDSSAFGLFVYPGGGNGMFGTPVRTATAGPVPGLLVAADVNCDGSLDILAPNQSAETVTVLLGYGNGHFEEAPQFAANVSSIQGIVSADFNRDGIPDVAVDASTYGQVSVLLGDGTGGFQAPKVSAIASLSGGLVTGDFNGDGKPDIATASGFEEINVSLGVGDGSFQPPIQTAKANGLVRIAAGDFNGDGKLDLLIHFLVGGDLVLYAGSGDGRFAVPVTIATITAISMAVADVNGDGALDVLLGFAAVSQAPTLRVLLGKGNGTFLAPVLSSLDDQVNTIGVGDFNEDGKPDVVVSYASRAQLSVLIGDGAGSFGSPALFQTSRYPRALAVGDFNGDGHRDVVLSGQDENVTVLAGTGDGRLGQAHVLSLPGTAIQTVMADFDGDGKPDLAVGCLDSNFGFPDFVVLVRNTSCEPRHLAVSVNPSTCVSPGSPFAQQPVLRVLDDGDNLIGCDPGTVSAAIVPGTGTAGATLAGQTSVPVAAGKAVFADLSMDQTGVGYVLQFEHAQAGRTRSRPITIGSAPPVSIEGPSVICASGMYQATAGFDTYAWSVDGAFVGTRSAIMIDGVAAGRGAHTLTVLATRAGCSSVASLPISVHLPLTDVTAPQGVCPYSSGHIASVPDAGPGASYAWSILNGVINTGAGTPSITFKAGPSGHVTLSVMVTNAESCSASGTGSVVIDRSLSCPPPIGFFTVTPCRLADTRGAPGPSGGPGLTAGVVRTFPVTGLCGIPESATAVAINVAVSLPSRAGDLRLYPGGTTAPLASTINFRTGIVRANNAIIPLGASGNISVLCDMTFGSTGFFFDVYGYFQ